jgi:hypothetical protein
MGHSGGGGLGWGNGNGGGYYADPLLRAYWMFGDAAYLDAASLNADFLLGANPLSKTFVTAMGARHPRQPQISPELYADKLKTGPTVQGITVFGLAGSAPPGYPAEVPLYRRWRDRSGGAEISSEFTITQTTGASAVLFAAFFGMETAGHGGEAK